MSLKYIRDTYKVPAFKGRKVRYTGHANPREGVIVGASDARLCVRLKGEHIPRIFHPTWEIEYLKDGEPADVRISLGDVIECDVKNPVPGVMRISLDTPEAVIEARGILDRKEGWWRIVPREMAAKAS